MAKDPPNLTTLPVEMVLHIFEYCDVQSLGRLARTCHYFKDLIYTESSIWKERSKCAIGSNTASPLMEKRCNPVLGFRQRCEISKYWKEGLGAKKTVIKYNKCMPWLALERDMLYCSKEDMLYQFPRNNYGHVKPYIKKWAKTGRDDVSKFALNDNEVVTGGRDGRIIRWSKKDLTLIHAVQGHTSDVLCVDSENDLIVSGSKDSTVKIWNSSTENTVCAKEIRMDIRVISTSILPSAIHLVIGLPGTRNIHPIQLFDIQRGDKVCDLGETYRPGGGVTDIYPECENTLLSCGYDTAVKLWDIRNPSECVSQFVDPFDNGIYCVRSDHNITILSGAQRNGIITLWDKRMSKKPVRVYHSYVKFSPVYGLEFDSTRLFAAYDRICYQYSYVSSNKNNRIAKF